MLDNASADIDFDQLITVKPTLIHTKLNRKFILDIREELTRDWRRRGFPFVPPAGVPFFIETCHTLHSGFGPNELEGMINNAIAITESHLKRKGLDHSTVLAGLGPGPVTSTRIRDLLKEMDKTIESMQIHHRNEHKKLVELMGGMPDISLDEVTRRLGKTVDATESQLLQEQLAIISFDKQVSANCDMPRSLKALRNSFRQSLTDRAFRGNSWYPWHDRPPSDTSS
ncbi:hypothetical protein HYQ45_018586 [Verticillium longisporum]|uniref:Uncharacterized protein n=1 Tax=Verticillium longisporum TaxID=100787 RepID=A0A8I3AEF7_VERLO|nr:hypothetical protein HYQ45_018586 [Verticillium longisporum]KAG7145988.1 hypothetical protein HYQ46_005231 [Verticillium longisporum]